MEQQEKKPLTFIGVAWLILFASVYPVIITFSLVFTGILWIFSSLSGLVSKFASLFVSKASLKSKPTTESSVVN